MKAILFDKQDRQCTYN